jgi:hypothetical protein
MGQVGTVNYGSGCGTLVEWRAVKDCRAVAVPDGAAMTLKGRRGRKTPSPGIATGVLNGPLQ